MSDKMFHSITAVVLTKNEEKGIGECLKNLQWCDEIIVIDDNSNDKAAETAKKLGAKVFTQSLDNDFSKQRNFGLSKAKNEWVLFVDADEKVSEAVASEISNFIHSTGSGQEFQISNNTNGFYIKRKDFLWGREMRYGETGSIKLLRLAKKDSGIWEGKVHEEWKIKGEIGELKGYLIHFPHENLTEFLGKINFYTNLRAKELYAKKTKSGFFSLIFFPLAKFILNYFIKLGILDGIPGLISAITMSFHSFLVRGKLWLLWQKK